RWANKEKASSKRSDLHRGKRDHLGSRYSRKSRSSKRNPSRRNHQYRKSKAKRDQIKEERAAKQKELKEKRTQRQKVMSKKTKKGQPVMKDRIEYLLKKIQESQSDTTM
ncbi:thyroid transcription factor 1-associated protein 26, partial [Hermetia illucens]|uniref:thyroid transcription factor 1-associated protein 26 n=1 Tax=Hermetia illucens TaxID=343691 RepID=UPI0018CC19F7